MRCSSERSVMTPVFWAKQDSMVATAAKAAQLPHCLWFLIRETTPWSLQSNELGAAPVKCGDGEEVMFCSGYWGIPSPNSAAHSSSVRSYHWFTHEPKTSDLRQTPCCAPPSGCSSS